MSLIDLTGQKFGRLTVIERAENVKPKVTFWRVVCECGNELAVRSGSLRNGDTQSCGCLHRERTSKANTRHGKAHSMIYNRWCAMLNRCYNPNVEQYPNYGQRGIRVCERWQKFENFYKDMGEPPQGTSLDRIDNDGDYCPENCSWRTGKEQQRNTRTNHLVTYAGETKTLAEWVDQLGLNYNKTKQRLYKGWTPERAFTT